MRRGSEESRNARKREGRMLRAINILCFILPRARTITSPVGGSEGGRGREEEEGAGEDGAGEEGRDGGGAGHGEGETSGGESGDVIITGVKGGDAVGDKTTTLFSRHQLLVPRSWNGMAGKSLF